VATSGIEDKAFRLLVAFHDLSGGALNEAVPLGGPDADAEDAEGAADRAGFGPDTAGRDVALRYLLDEGYLRRSGGGSGYALTVIGLDRAREIKGFPAPTPPRERIAMNDQTQRRLVTILSTAIALAVSQPLTNYIAEQIPERRGMKDDLLEAALQGAVRAASIFAASVIVREVVRRLR
jgi:hypothetical protein